MELERRLNVSAFGTIPYMQTPSQAVFKRAFIVLAVILPVLVVGIGIYLLHTYYTPIDLLVEQISDRLGLEAMLRRLGLS